MRVLCLALLVLLAPATGAQSTTTKFGIWPDSADLVSRSGVPGTSPGDLLIEVRGLSFAAPGQTGADFAGVGDVGRGRGRVRGFGVIVQDQDCRTPEVFDLVIVREDPSAPRQPAAPPAGNPNGPEVLFRSPPIQTRPGCPAFAFAYQVTFATPADVLPERATFFYGCGLSANPLWTADGLAVHMASLNGVGVPFPNLGDNPRDGQRSLHWARDVTNGSVAQSLLERTHAMFLLLDRPVLNPGADIDPAAQLAIPPNYPPANPNFGMAGHYPDSSGVGNAARVGRYGPSGAPGGTYLGRAGVGDGLAFRIDTSASRGPILTQILWATGFAPPATIPGIGGRLYLDPHTLGAVPGGQSNGPAGTTVINLLTPGGFTAGAAGVRVYWQAAVWDQALATIVFSNGTSTSF